MRLEPSEAFGLLEAMAGKRVLVLGDVILDRYELGEVVKLSREAPVPVLRRIAQKHVPGGAANVAMNVRSLGGDARLVSAVGEDEEAAELRRLLDDGRVRHELFGEPGRSTTFKTRFVEKTQQLLRLDREIERPLAPGTHRAVLELFERLVPAVDCVVFSDYAKGFFSSELASGLSAAAARYGVPVVVDPKPPNHYLCENCHLFMPNRIEGALIAGLATAEVAGGLEIAGALLEKYGTNVLLTDGKNGMFVARPGQEVVHMESRAMEVFDVSGAGDTVAAAVALAVGAGLDLLQAAAVANEAAGVVVSKLGTATVSPEEVALRAGGTSKVLDRERMEAVVGGLQRGGKSVVFTNGCFDLLHVGHIKYLKAARALGDALVVALNSDASVRRLKGPDRPLIEERQRAELIAALESVDYVTLFDEDTPVELLSRLRPDVFVKGGDYTEETLPEAPVVRSYGGRVEIVALYGGGISTTRLIERISGTGEGDE